MHLIETVELSYVLKLRTLSQPTENVVIALEVAKGT